MGRENIYFVPAPTGGWNTRDPLALMPETDAVVLDNVFPDTDACRLRGGKLLFGETASDEAVGTMATLFTAADAEKLMVFTDIDIYDFTSGTPSSIIGSLASYNTQYWQTCTHRHRIFAVNGLNPPISWTGTGNVAATAWTGSGLTITNLVNVASYKARLYFCEKDTANIWYSAINAITGTLTKFNLEDLLYLGGSILFCGSSSKQTASVDQELFVAVSSRGEVLVYQGLSPADSTWTLIARYFTAPVLGYRCGFYIGPDLHLITQQGTIPMSQLFANIDVNNQYLVVSGKVAKVFNEAATSIFYYPNWRGVWFPQGRYAIIQAGLNGFQFVMNTITKAWCRFNGWGDTPVDWVVFDNKLYYGEMTGKIYQADVLEEYNDDDDELIAAGTIQSAFNYLGRQDINKKTNLAQPMFSSSNPALDVDTSQALSLSLNVDFSSDATASSIKYVSGGDDAPILNKTVVGAPALGKAVSVTYEVGGDVTGQIPQEIKFFGTWLQFEDGGML